MSNYRETFIDTAILAPALRARMLGVCFAYFLECDQEVLNTFAYMCTPTPRFISKAKW